MCSPKLVYKYLEQHYSLQLNVKLLKFSSFDSQKQKLYFNCLKLIHYSLVKEKESLINEWINTKTSDSIMKTIMQPITAINFHCTLRIEQRNTCLLADRLCSFLGMLIVLLRPMILQMKNKNTSVYFRNILHVSFFHVRVLSFLVVVIYLEMLP